MLQVRGARLAEARTRAVALLAEAAGAADDDTRLQRAVPYLLAVCYTLWLCQGFQNLCCNLLPRSLPAELAERLRSAFWQYMQNLAALSRGRGACAGSEVAGMPGLLCECEPGTVTERLTSCEVPVAH